MPKLVQGVVLGFCLGVYTAQNYTIPRITVIAARALDKIKSMD